MQGHVILKKHALDFEIEEYVCISCRNLIDNIK